MAPQRQLPLARLGIIGGGQLARMMIPPATDLGCDVTVLDPTPDSPAGQLAGAQIVGAFDDPAALRRLVEQRDVTTYDIETIDATVLAELAAEGHRILPDPSVLLTIQDKLAQKQALVDAGLPTSPFVQLDDPTPDAMIEFGLPMVQKTRRGGYDGRGVAVFKDAIVADDVLKAPSLLERFVDFRAELGVVVARGADGETAAYPVAEMVFDDRANVLDLLLAPARIDPAIAARAREVALAAVTALKGVGVFGVELFLTFDDAILINEIAPRTHNSGHWSIEGCTTSQFEQLVRAVLGLPLGSVHQHSPAAMVNLLGSEGAHGTPVLHGLDAALAEPGVGMHLYGKREVRPFRKMGHFTVTGESIDAVLDRARRVKALLTVGGSETAQESQAS